MSKLHIPVPLRRHVGGVAYLELSGATVADLLEAAGTLHTALREKVLDTAGNLCEALNVFVDLKDIRDLEGVGTPVRDGANVWILPRVGGGSGAGTQ